MNKKEREIIISPQQHSNLYSAGHWLGTLSTVLLKGTLSYKMHVYRVKPPPAVNKIYFQIFSARGDLFTILGLIGHFYFLRQLGRASDISHGPGVMKFR